MTTKEANLWQNRGILMVLLIFCLTPLNLTAQAKETGKPLFVLFR